MASVDVNALVAKLQEYFNTSEIIGMIDRIRDEKIEPMEKANLAIDLVQIILDEFREFLGDIKKLETNEELFDVVTRTIDELIKLPFYLEFFDGPAIKAALKMVIKVVSKYL